MKSWLGMEEIRLTTWDVFETLKIMGYLQISTGAGFWPSTVGILIMLIVFNHNPNIGG